jgi:P-type E1-E2 ATPase
VPLPGILNIFKQFGSWTILSTNFVPISLMVTLEFISLLQTYFLVRDQTFYNEDLQIGCEVQSSNLHEELGQIDTVFTDKTGTLTKNEMKLKAF